MLGLLKKKEGPPKAKKDEKNSPDANRVVLQAKRVKPAKDVAQALKKLSFLHVENGGETVTATHVESVDLENKPYKYWLASFKPNEVCIEWTTTHEEHSAQRRVEVSKNVFQLLSLVRDAYPLDAATLRPLVLDAMEQAVSDSLKTGGELAVENDSLHRKAGRLEKERKELEKTLEKLGGEVTQLKTENEGLREKLSLFEKVSDDALKTRIMDAVEGNGTIALQEFAEENGVAVPRVENALDELVKEGYLQPMK